jgi:hypothetical protein
VSNVSKNKKHCGWQRPEYAKDKMNVHHRCPKSRGGTSNTANLSTVPIYLHEAFNALFGGNATAEEVAYILTKIWVDPAYVIVAVLKEDCGLINVISNGTYQSSH